MSKFANPLFGGPPLVIVTGELKMERKSRKRLRYQKFLHDAVQETRAEEGVFMRRNIDA